MSTVIWRTCLIIAGLVVLNAALAAVILTAVRGFSGCVAAHVRARHSQARYQVAHFLAAMFAVTYMAARIKSHLIPFAPDLAVQKVPDGNGSIEYTIWSSECDPHITHHEAQLQNCAMQGWEW